MRSTAAALLVLGSMVGCVAEDAKAVADSGSGAAADTIRVLAYNIHHGEGMDSLLDLERIAELILEVDPDLVALQEVDSLAERTERVDQAAVLGELTGMEHRFGHFMPYQGGAYGMGVLTRLPIRSTENLRLPDGDEPRSALTLTVELPATGRPLTFSDIHFYRTEEERLAQAESLETHLRDRDGPAILAGDFNSEPETAVMNRLAETWTIIDKGTDRFTYPSFGPEREIDFVLVRPRSSFETLFQDVLDEPVISDHRPVVVDLVVR